MKSSINTVQSIVLQIAVIMDRKEYKFDSFLIDASEYRLLKNEAYISLKPKAFDTLLYLIQKNGHIVGKDELLDAVWPNSYVSETSLAQNIYQLRKVLGNKEDGTSYIETIPRRGYRFNADIAEVSDTLPEETNKDENKDNIEQAKKVLIPIETKDRLQPVYRKIQFASAQSNRQVAFHHISLLKKKLVILAIIFALITSSLFFWNLLDKKGRISYNGEKIKIISSTNIQQPLQKQNTYNTEAYQNYLMGITLSYKRNLKALNQAIFYFKKAVELDSNYSLAYAGLADVYHLIALQIKDFETKSNYIYKAETLALKALTINNTLAEAYTVIAAVNLFKRDKLHSEEAYKKAIALNPDYSSARLRYGWLLFEQGKLEEAISEMRNAQELDPLSAASNLDLSFLLILARRFDEALKYCKRAIELEPDIPHGYRILARIYLHKGMYDYSANAYKDAAKNSAERNYSLLGEAYIHALGGRRLSALKILSSVESKEPSFDPYHIALVYAALGKTDNALNWLTRLKADCPIIPMMLRFDPRLDVIRNNPHFEQLLKIHPIKKIHV